MELCQGVSLRVLSTEKFKDIGIFFRFIQPLDETAATCCSLLALMLSDRCEAYPSKQAMSEKLDALYGMSIGAQTIGYGQAQVLELRSRLIHPRFAKSSAFLRESVSFLQELLFHPLLNEENLQEAKRSLQAKMERMRDDAAQYVVQQGLRSAGEGTPLAISSLGSVERLANITLTDVQRLHRRLLTESAIEILICGDLSESEGARLFRSFAFSARSQHVATHYVVDHARAPQTVWEKRDLPQSSIMLVYFTHTDILDESYYALRVMNAMLGQYSTSLLFQNVREKRSLCYSIYSSLISFDGALGITTGVEHADVEEAVRLIQEQVELLRQGMFDDELLTVSKTMLCSSLKASDDVMNAMVAQQYQNDLLKRCHTSDTMIEAIRAVEREQVIEAAKRLELKTVYIVSGKEETA